MHIRLLLLRLLVLLLGAKCWREDAWVLSSSGILLLPLLLLLSLVLLLPLTCERRVYGIPGARGHGVELGCGQDDACSLVAAVWCLWNGEMAHIHVKGRREPSKC